MKNPKFSLLDTKTINQQIQEIQDRMVVRQFNTKLHMYSLKQSFRAKLSSPTTLAAAGGIGFALGYLNPFTKPKPQPEHEQSDDELQSKSFLDNHSLLATALKALPIIELVWSLMPSKKDDSAESNSGDEGPTDEEIFKEATLMQAMSGQSSYHEFNDGVRKSLKMKGRPVDFVDERMKAEREGLRQDQSQDSGKPGSPPGFLH